MKGIKELLEEGSINIDWGKEENTLGGELHSISFDLQKITDEFKELNKTMKAILVKFDDISYIGEAIERKND